MPGRDPQSVGDWYARMEAAETDRPIIRLAEPPPLAAWFFLILLAGIVTGAIYVLCQ